MDSRGRVSSNSFILLFLLFFHSPSQDLLLLLWRCGPFPGCGHPDLLPHTFSVPSCRLPVPCLDHIYGIPPNCILPSTLS